MKKLTFVLLFAVSGVAHGQALGLKAGLWETKIIHQVMDGKDMAQQIQAAMANMTPEQRAQMAGAMKNMAGQNGSVRTCVSAAMVAKQSSLVDPEGHCSAISVTPNGNKINFSFTCNHNGHSSTGSGVRIVNGNSVSTHLDMTITDGRGQHKMQSDTEMTYLGSDCQGVQPMDEMMKSMQGQHQ